VEVLDSNDDDNSGGPNSNDPHSEAFRKCCNQCCVKIPLIGLKCPEDADFEEMTPTIIATPFARRVCNNNQIKGLCLACGGSFTPMIGPWVACKLEGIAVWLNMLKFDFYNDWVNGTLYFPLIKRKYKLKKRKKKFGQIKKDKFCDFDCDEFQGNQITEYSIRMFYNDYGSVNVITGGCKARLSGQVPYTSNWVTSENMTPDLAQVGCWNQLNEIIGGKNVQTQAPCTPNLQLYDDNQYLNTYNITVDVMSRVIPNEHAKPRYITTKDPVTGVDTQVNVGGHSHHKNKCNKTYRHEKWSFIQDHVGCEKISKKADSDCEDDGDGSGISIGETVSEDDDLTPDPGPGCDSNKDQCDLGGGCSWGANSCSGICRPRGTEPSCPCINCLCDHSYGDHEIKHGMAKWEDSVIYYPSVIPKGDLTHNESSSELKGNLLFPTNICEVGSSVFCDIDDTPFVMDQLSPTTFQISEEGEKFKAGPNPTTDISEITDKGDAGVNLRAYVDFGCVAAHCVNPNATTVQSQLGIDMLDKNEVGKELGACKILFDHDEEIREYFCKRFSTYKPGDSLDVHYQRPGGPEFENNYATYAEFTSVTGITYVFTPPQGNNEAIPNGGDINDGDPFIPGDRCGMVRDNTYVNNFYGVDIPGVKSMNAYYKPSDEFNDIELGGTQTWDTIRGVNHVSSHTPYFFYFGIVPGKTALHKVVGKYFADKINKTTLAGLPGSQNASQNINNQTNHRNSIKNPFSILKSCLGERLTINNQP